VRADRVLVLDGGRLVQDGPHAQLVTEDGRYARLYEAWMAATSASIG
jgi:ABC-type multidrug transport system fused ATPase/permease subunit